MIGLSRMCEKIVLLFKGGSLSSKLEYRSELHTRCLYLSCAVLELQYRDGLVHL